LEVLTAKRIKPYIGKKEAQKVMITITIVKFPVIAGYGTYVVSSPNLLKKHEYSV